MSKERVKLIIIASIGVIIIVAITISIPIIATISTIKNIEDTVTRNENPIIEDDDEHNQSVELTPESKPNDIENKYNDYVTPTIEVKVDSAETIMDYVEPTEVSAIVKEYILNRYTYGVFTYTVTDECEVPEDIAIELALDDYFTFSNKDGKVILYVSDGEIIEVFNSME